MMEKFNIIWIVYGVTSSRWHFDRVLTGKVPLEEKNRMPNKLQLSSGCVSISAQLAHNASSTSKSTKVLFSPLRRRVDFNIVFLVASLCALDADLRREYTRRWSFPNICSEVPTWVDYSCDSQLQISTASSFDRSILCFVVRLLLLFSSSWNHSKSSPTLSCLVFTFFEWAQMEIKLYLFTLCGDELHVKILQHFCWSVSKSLIWKLSILHFGNSLALSFSSSSSHASKPLEREMNVYRDEKKVKVKSHHSDEMFVFREVVGKIFNLRERHDEEERVWSTWSCCSDSLQRCWTNPKIFSEFCCCWDSLFPGFSLLSLFSLFLINFQQHRDTRAEDHSAQIGSVFPFSLLINSFTVRRRWFLWVFIMFPCWMLTRRVNAIRGGWGIVGFF